MKVFKKRISTYKILLCASVLTNVLLVGAVYVAEKQCKVFSMALERRNIITISDQAHPDYWALVGWTNTVAKLHTEFDVAFFGNSLTRGSDFQSFFPDKKIINLGYSGDNMTGMLRRVPMLQAARPKKIFIMAGTNDLFHLNVDEFADRYNKLLDAICDSIPDATIYLQSVLPMNQDLKADAPSDEKIRQANQRLNKIATERNLQYIDIYSAYVKDGKLPTDVTKEGIHLYPKSYYRWADIIESFVEE